MADRPYDHHSKAGNRGDVVKHVALAAAIRSTLDAYEGPVFRYADTYAGYAWNPLSLSGGWREGIGEAAAAIESRGAHGGYGDPTIRWWYDRYLSPGHSPERPDDCYPGSSIIASDLLAEWSVRRQGTTYSLALWDTSRAVVDDLGRCLPERSRQVFPRPASPNEQAIREADFLFIDPPFASDWPAILPFLQGRPQTQAVLVWLPLYAPGNGGPAAKPGTPGPADLARATACSTMEVRWTGDNRLAGCQLLHSLKACADDGLRKAVRNLTHLLGWDVAEYAKVVPETP